MLKDENDLMQFMKINCSYKCSYLSIISGKQSTRSHLPVRSASSAVSKYQPHSRAGHQAVYCAFPVAAAQVWNGLPEAVVSSSSLQTFRRQLKTHLYQLSYPHLIFYRLTGIVTVVLVVL